MAHDSTILTVYPQIREVYLLHEFCHAYNLGYKVNMPQCYEDNRQGILATGYQFNKTTYASEAIADFLVAWTHDAWNHLKARKGIADTMIGYSILSN